MPLLRVFLPLPTGLGGGSASGKTTVARMIIEALDVPWVVLLSMDSFYKVGPPTGEGCVLEAHSSRPGRGPEPAAPSPPSAGPPHRDAPSSPHRGSPLR